MYVLLEFWQKIMAIPIMNPLSWFMIKQVHRKVLISVFWHGTSQLYHVYSYDIIVINTRTQTRVITTISNSYRGITITQVMYEKYVTCVVTALLEYFINHCCMFY